ncbi:MAG: bifunctional diaminohydroxyphosphoribosylaminopyrimidine deaminase/5-amino-6-(5-phosphoribosylamino)uracil reductase RibD [Gammaproteobacteria bacterium]|nr:bifunctional diaminohydroxyphosphoribosylaminopyrimidine deaminase/5-amino-6-(5-phosphoribosylamino)uracil reductase RibD [Pseudomonadales bacterium]MCP5348638.1 bifunctional diaminohydroxyphosphoribosylaminopyrimidine deaminase/5-amino-6-(5-phosphoribosylamino)uracil reductase RibD [Pseudomonadales bacterium]
MRHALQLAERVFTATPNPRVGCVIVAAEGDNRVVGEGWHQRPGAEHAEIHALARAGELARGSTVFVTLEPCSHHGKTPPCADALVAAGVKRVVIASLDPFPKVAGSGVQRLEQAGVEVIQLSDFESRARAINRGYFKRQTTGLPFVRCKLAMSLDGRTAAANRESRWITGPQARTDVQRMRAASCAIVTGVGTVLEDDPALTVRLEQLDLTETQRQDNAFALSRQPLRVVMDSSLRIPVKARILEQSGATLLITHASSGPCYPGATEIVTVPVESADTAGRVSPATVLELLASRYDVNEVLLEAGPVLAGAFVQAGLVDELTVYIAGKLLGSKGLPLLELPGLQSMTDQIELAITSVTRVGDDCRIVASFGQPASNQSRS